MTAALLPTYSLWTRDLKHFVRQRSRVVGAIGQPFVIWILLAAGFKNTASAAGTDFGAYLFPGVILLIALFAAIFSTISVIDDRRSGFLQAVLASPATPAAIVTGKLLAGTTIALAQTLIFLVLLPFTGITLTLEAFLLSMVVLGGTGMLLTALGFLLAWRMTSTQGFHAVMNLLLLPLWMLSGAFFPLDGAAGWMQVIMRLNPMYYITTLYQNTFFLGSGIARIPGPAPWISIAVLAGLFVLLYAVSLRSVRVS